MTSGYPYSPHYNNRNSNTASTSNSNNPSPWNNASFNVRGEENDSLTLPPISRANSGNRLELPGLSSSPLFIPETHHPRQGQPEPPSYGLRANSNTNSNLIPNTNTTAASSTSTSTAVTLSNPQPQLGRSQIKRPRSASPPDLFSFDPYDESNRYRSPPPPPPQPSSNQVAQQPPRGSSLFDEDAEALTNFDWHSFLSQNDDDIDDPFATPPRIPSRASDTRGPNHGLVDLTDSSPSMAPPPERRRALSGTSLRPATLTRPKSPKRRKRLTPESKSSKRRRLSPPKINSDEEVEVVDLAENSNLQEYEAAKAKRQEELIIQQNQDEATKPVKLVDFQCIICMDNPTDLTVTHCGHLFCSECLHSALYAGNNGRKTCPVCRTAISTTSIPGRKPPKNGTFPISIKLMTANKKGKKPGKN